MSEKAENSNKIDYVELLKKLDEAEKKRKEEENQKRIGELTVGELKDLIRATVKQEASFGDLPLLNRKRKDKLEKWLWKSLAILILSGLAYKTFWYESDYFAQINQDKMFLRKTVGWTSEKKEIKVLGGKWQLCSIYDGRDSCSPIFTPLEAKYNDNYKFVFVGRGNVFWVKNDQTQITLVKLIDGSWSFKNEYDDDWTDFDSLYDYQDYEPADRN